jgi:hypothetical protein
MNELRQISFDLKDVNTTRAEAEARIRSARRKSTLIGGAKLALGVTKIAVKTLNAFNGGNNNGGGDDGGDLNFDFMSGGGGGGDAGGSDWFSSSMPDMPVMTPGPVESAAIDPVV